MPTFVKPRIGGPCIEPILVTGEGGVNETEEGSFGRILNLALFCWNMCFSR